jgi:hypothetical protein
VVDHPARLFVCARCREQVLLCSRCDSGQRYCGRTCSRAARLESRRAAGRRYQRSRAGRLAHAARSRRWRQRRRQVCASEQRADQDAAALDGGVINFVTHQGSPAPALDAPLPPAAELAAAVSGARASPTPCGAGAVLRSCRPGLARASCATACGAGRLAWSSPVPEPTRPFRELHWSSLPI